MSYKHITGKDLHHLMQRNEQVMIIDVRSAEEFESMRLPGSFNIPLPILSSAEVSRLLRLKGLPETIPLYITCAVGPRAIIACSLLENDFENVYHLVGCLKAWAEDGLPIHSGKL